MCFIIIRVDTVSYYNRIIPLSLVNNNNNNNVLHLYSIAPFPLYDQRRYAGG
jgi:hypothetical protein